MATDSAPKSDAATSRAPAIIIENVSKRFRLVQQGYAGIKGRIGALVRGVRPTVTYRDALQNVTLTIAQGETVALIGTNGSGKSTLLALLAHVMLPDAGRIGFPNSKDPQHPRMAPLLELGAGFHPDLTGLQNVFFNGSILGQTRAEMQARLPEIIAFADLADGAMNVPVRTYSSGMRARLGFAVAIHTKPEIVLVDEVLAVGDEAFQEKCLQKIAEFQSEGRTIVFVSHDMTAVRRVATRVVWLHEGILRKDSLARVEGGAGSAIEDVIAAYHEATRAILP